MTKTMAPKLSDGWAFSGDSPPAGDPVRAFGVLRDELTLLYGAMARKGEATSDRPRWRSTLLHVPARLMAASIGPRGRPLLQGEKSSP